MGLWLIECYCHSPRFAGSTGNSGCVLVTLCLQLCNGSWTHSTTGVWTGGTPLLFVSYWLELWIWITSLNYFNYLVMFLLTVCHIVDHASGDIDEVHTTHHWPAEWEPLGEQGCLHALCWCCVGWVSCIYGNLSSIITMATGFLKVSLYFAFMSFMLHVHMFPLYIMRRTYLAVKWVIAYSMLHSEIRSLISITVLICFWWNVPFSIQLHVVYLRTCVATAGHSRRMCQMLFYLGKL